LGSRNHLGEDEAPLEVTWRGLALTEPQWVRDLWRWQELGRTVTSDAVAPNSSSLLAPQGSGTLGMDSSTKTANGGNSMYEALINVVPGSQPLVPLSIWEYTTPVDPSSLFANMSIQGWYSSLAMPPGRGADPGSDHHAIVMVRDESTGGISQLYEI
jgi:hypothetical protein